MHHLDVELRALLEPLRLEQPAGMLQLGQPLLQLDLDAPDRLIERRLRRHIVRVRVELDEGELHGLGAGQRIELDDAVDLVAEQLHAPGPVLHMRRPDVDGVAANAEGATAEGGVVALVVQRHEVGDELALGDLLLRLHGHGHGRVGLDRADAVDAGDGGHHHHVVALEQRPCRRMAHAVDLLVHRGFLLDVGVGARHIGFGLVVVVVGDEILDRVVGEEALELAVELGGERLVGREDQRRALGAVRSPAPWCRSCPSR